LKPRKVLSNSRNHFEWPKACLSRRVGLRTACARLPFPKVVPVLQIAAEIRADGTLYREEGAVRAREG